MSPNFSGPWSFTYCEHSLWSAGPATAARSGAIWPFRSSRRSLEELTSASAYVVKVHDTSTCALCKWVALLAIYSVCGVRCISEQNGHCVHSQFTTHMIRVVWQFEEDLHYHMKLMSLLWHLYNACEVERPEWLGKFSIEYLLHTSQLLPSSVNDKESTLHCLNNMS